MQKLLLSGLTCLAFVACKDEPMVPGEESAQGGAESFAGQRSEAGQAEGGAQLGSAEGGMAPQAGAAGDAGSGQGGAGEGTGLAGNVLTDVVSISSNCAVVADGSVWCWGANTQGFLGVQDSNLSVPYAVQVPGVVDAVKISSGPRQTCALSSDKTVKCWGNTSSGLIGNPAATGRLSAPIEVVGLTGVEVLVAGDELTCAVVGDGRLLCWGSSGNATLWDQGFEDALTPVEITDVVDAIGADVGNNHSCVFKGESGVDCWGSNAGGALLRSSLGGVWGPATIDLAERVIDVGAGYAFTCALLETGKVWCWGQGAEGRLGQPPVSPDQIARQPLEVPSLDAVLDITVRGLNGCAVRDGGTVHCWGRGVSDLPNEDGLIDYLPVGVEGLSGAVEVAIGSFSSCARVENGTVACWGSNGDGSVGSGSFEPTEVPLLVVKGELVVP